MRKFETGAVVKLKSGGYPMTVSDPLRSEAVLIDVHWHDAGGILQRDAFHEDCLMACSSAVEPSAHNGSVTGSNPVAPTKPKRGRPKKGEERAKPWEAKGISKASWYRRQKEAKE